MLVKTQRDDTGTTRRSPREASSLHTWHPGISLPCDSLFTRIFPPRDSDTIKSRIRQIQLGIISTMAHSRSSKIHFEWTNFDLSRSWGGRGCMARGIGRDQGGGTPRCLAGRSGRCLSVRAEWGHGREGRWRDRESRRGNLDLPGLKCILFSLLVSLGSQDPAVRIPLPKCHFHKKNKIH